MTYTIQLPASKSICNRALIINALAGQNALPDHLSDCDDTRVMLKALSDPHAEVIDVQAAGTAMRFLTAYLSISQRNCLLTGTERMRQRPIAPLVDALRRLGADITYADKSGFPPLYIGGRSLHGGHVALPGHISSQFISALLMIAPYLSDGLHLYLEGEVISRPYIDLTIHLMRDFGAQVAWDSENNITVSAHPYSPTPYRIESDWSAASYWYELVALSDDMDILLPELYADSYQGDHRVAHLYRKLGVYTTYTDAGVHLHKAASPTVTRMDEDLVDIPDLAQTFVVTCALMGIPFRFTGLQSLRIKETDRISALMAELRKLGYVLRSENDSILVWDGERCEAAPLPIIATYDDHRMAMAFAPAKICFPALLIEHPEVVSKSYPHYWDDLRQVGIQVATV